MTILIGISGSLRAASYNTALLRAAAARLPDGASLSLGDIRDIPLYNGDLEAAQGIPPAVTTLKEAIAASGGLILATPEYNNSMPGVLKNAIDWLSRPPADIKRVFRGKPVAIIGATPGGFGTVLGQHAWLPVLRMLGMRHWSEGRLMIAKAQSAIDANGTVVDPAVEEQLRDYLAGFVAFCRLQGSSPA